MALGKEVISVLEAAAKTYQGKALLGQKLNYGNRYIARQQQAYDSINQALSTSVLNDYAKMEIAERMSAIAQDISKKQGYLKDPSSVHFTSGKYSTGPLPGRLLPDEDYQKMLKDPSRRSELGTYKRQWRQAIKNGEKTLRALRETLEKNNPRN